MVADNRDLRVGRVEFEGNGMLYCTVYKHVSTCKKHDIVQH